MSEWTRVRELFGAAADMPGPEQAEFLDRECHGDAGLRGRVDRLLAADAVEEGAAGAVPFEDAESARLFAATATDCAGQMIGAYQIVRVLGQGGMGIVFEARQEQPSRSVALKMLSSPLVTDAERARFEYEVEVLGRLQHPAIAQVFDAGSWQDPATGRTLPWFAMELVADARPLTTHAVEHGLDAKQRVQLLAEVAEAVQHGHAIGVLHRDLKPDNILIDGAGRPKVIDFGTARSTDPATTRHTMAGIVIGTPLYMSPEQFEGDPASVDAQSDVYALGVILYELLTDRPPIEPGPDTWSRFADRVRRAEPKRPSMLRTGLSARGFDDDLDWICLTALAKVKSERYATVAQLLEDLRRYLRGESVLAGPPSVTRSLRRFVRRHRGLVGAAAAMLVTVLVGATVATIGWMQAAQARELATAEAAAEAAARNWFTSLASQARVTSRGKDVLLIDVLATGEQRIAELRSQPATTEAVVRNSIAATLISQQQPKRALALLDGGLERARRELGDEHSATLVTRFYRGQALLDLGKLDDAIAELDSTLRGRSSRFGADGVEVAEVQFKLGHAWRRRGDLDRAERLVRQAAQTLRRELGPAHRDVLRAGSALAIILGDRGKTAQAIATMRETLVQAQVALGPNDPTVLSILGGLGVMLRDAGRQKEALPVMERVLVVQRAIFGERSPNALNTMSSIAAVRADLGDLDRAEQILRAVVAVHDETEVDPQLALVARNNLASTLRRGGRYASALPIYDDLLRRAVKIVPESHWMYATFQLGRGTTLRLLERREAAERDLLASLDSLAKKVGDEHFRTQKALQEVIELYRGWGRADDAERFAVRLRAAQQEQKGP